jgi:hypothetical protein
MKKSIITLIVLIVVAIIISGFTLIGKKGADYKNISYNVENEQINLVNGSSGTYKYFGNEAKGDLNGDGKDDVVFLLTNNPGGSGTFFYAVAALSSANSYVGSNAILLGDRISPQSTEIRSDGVIVVNYADRGPNEPMAASPTIGKSKYIRLEEGALIEFSPTSVTTTLSGTFVCLPHKNPGEVQTMECAYGMKADNGNNYALDFSSSSTSAFDLPMGKKYTVTGLLTPVEALDNDHWKIYDIKGIMKVSSYEESKSDIKEYPVGSSINLELKKPVIVAGTTIRASAITEDSRCASDVQCIQAGRVKVLFSINSPSGPSTAEITPGTIYTTETLSIKLDDVKPYPISTHKITDDEYRVTISVKGK